MNELKVFHNSEFGELGVMMIDGKEYFPATQCAKILGYADPSKAVKQHCDEKGWVNRPVLTNGGSQNVKFITEGNLYRLIVRSKLPVAKRFERWVFDEVLPEIRRTGGYGSVNIEEVITKAVTTAVSETVKALIPLITAQHTSEKRVAIICKPKVRYKIDLLPAEIRKQVDNMLCSGKYTSKEVSKYIQEQTGLYISYVTLCNYKKTHFILVEDDVQLSLF